MPDDTIIADEGQKHAAGNQAHGVSSGQSNVALPTISLPRGGGAVRGMGEKFAANPVTGTGALSVPILTSPGRSGFFPQLSLSYDSGAGNGSFGFGWHLSIPAITRKTEKGLPRYRDQDESDTFVLSDAEDLVPTLIQQGGDWVKESLPAMRNGMSYTIQRYRPRVEGLFARIERWRNESTRETHWKTISKDNITSFYGQSGNSQIADPEDRSRVFSWLLDTSYDDKGNVIVYEYKAEDKSNIALSLHEENHQVAAGRYLKHIEYGNRTPYYPDDTKAQPLALPTDWAFRVVFDYGEHDLQTPRVDEDVLWKSRPDPFSTYRAGFEIRDYRLCRRVLMFHHFARELGAEPCLVRSTDFTYSHELRPDDPFNSIYSFIASITQKGYLKKASGYESKSLPALEFAYTEVKVDEDVHSVDAASLANLPYGTDGVLYQWIDLDGEGLPGILTEQADAWFYKRNVSNLPTDGKGISARFEALEVVVTKPSLADLRNGQQLMDLSAKGQLCLVQLEPPLSGFYERDQDAQWQPFSPFASLPRIDWHDSNLKFVDLNGDGHADILITEDEVFTWYPSLAKEGFGPAESVRKVFDEEKGPALVFADSMQSIYLSDLSGDGLTDLVRIRNGEVCYWPNLGYGSFGAKITMDDAPIFDHPGLFDQKRIRLADIDGSGTTDIIYLGRNKINLYFNQSGNSWSAPRELSQFPVTVSLDSVIVVDLLGNGTACLVWSSPLPGDAANPMRYIDLMGGQKPHLLLSSKNNLGMETRVGYAASTRFYLQDRAAGRPWITRLPFPVHVVERVETYDYISQTKFVSLYQYHHGYFDGPEREFRGFGMVEQIDTESFSKFSGAGLFTETPEVAGEEFHLPPVRTRTWFHDGAYVERDNISRHFADEYYQGDDEAKLLPDTILPVGLTTQEEREACRALKGHILRQEVYSDDNSPDSAHPYSATEYAYSLRVIQPATGHQHAVLYPYECEALAYHYERKPADPRVSHQMTLEVDEFGNALKFVAIGYARRAPIFVEQQPTLITYTENQIENRPDEPGWYRIGFPIETRTYELTGVPRANPGAPYTPDDLKTAVASASAIPYERTPTNNTTEKRLIEHARTLYLKNDLSGPLPLTEVESLALPYESYRLALTPGLLQIYSTKIGSSELRHVLQAEGHYLLGDDYKANKLFPALDPADHWWIASGRILLSPDPANPDQVFANDHFYLPQGSIDPFGNLTHITYDAHNLLLERSEDALHNVVIAQNDYRVMQPVLVTDPNLNRAAVNLDALGMVIATAVMGKQGQNEGDTLDDPTMRLKYDLFNWQNNQQPVFVHVFAREQHGAANPRWQESFSYSDGMGREVMRRVQAEPGLAPARDSNGALKHDPNGNLIFEFTKARWVGTGRSVFDNKGNPVKKYEPFFDSAFAYEDEKELVEWGVTAILRYDQLGRLIRTDLPNGTFSTVEFDPWQQIASDGNDTVITSQWYVERGSPDPAAPEPNDPETRAAWLAASHANTPAFAHFDTLGRTFLTIADNGAVGKYETRVELDIEGNQRSITDALRRKVMLYDYDMLSTRIHQSSVDAGERWMLNDCVGKPLRAWDSRDHQFRHEYDVLHRPVNLFVQTGNAVGTLAERLVYGEGQLNDQGLNLRGKIFQQFDGAGVVTSNQFDFKGNLLNGSRQLLRNYKDEVDWSQSPALEGETFTSSTTYDALNRPVTLTTPDASVTRATYNEANLLERLDVNLRGAAAANPFVTNIDHNARGQRELVEYGNGARTIYGYDPNTFSLINLSTTRKTDNAVLQDLSYTYDPVGNITGIRDAAQQTIYFKNQVVSANTKYVYDAIYRLVGADGREHIGQLAEPQTTWDDKFRISLPHPNDGQAMRNYHEGYQYDPVGNILGVIHTAANGNWTRTYAYDEPNPNAKNNRLTSTNIGAVMEQYPYDAHGNMTEMPHLPLMEWDFKDELHVTQRQVVNNAPGEQTYYVYNAAGQRVRKVTESANGIKGKERFYLGGFELYREYGGGGSIALERETLHVMDDTQRIGLVETKTIDTSAPPISLPRILARYQFDNHLGSASLELDDTGSVISYEEYYAYGSSSYQANRNDAEVSLKRYRYSGMERDEETGFNYHGARYYAPWLGRWTACDPIGIGDGINIYCFVRGNPVVLKDPSGTQGFGAVADRLCSSSDPKERAMAMGCPTAGPSLFAVAPKPGSTATQSPPASPPKTKPAVPKEKPFGIGELKQIAEFYGPHHHYSETAERVFGAGKAVGGFLELGAALLLSETVVGAVVVGQQGLDDSLTGMRQVMTGKSETSFKYKLGSWGASQFTADKQWQNVGGQTADIFGTAGAGAVGIWEATRPLSMAALEAEAAGRSAGAVDLVGQTKEQAEYLRGLQRSDPTAVPIGARIGKGNRVLGGAEVTHTGERAFARSSATVADLDPVLQANLWDYWALELDKIPDVAKLGPPGAHGEVGATNRLLVGARESGAPINLSDIQATAVQLKGAHAGETVPPCVNCWWILGGVNF